jgi:hypothetical protein
MCPFKYGLMRLKRSTSTSMGTKTGRFLIGVFQDQAPSGHLSCFWGSFRRHLGFFREKGSLWDAHGLPLGPLWALGASNPCVGAGGGLCFS